MGGRAVVVNVGDDRAEHGWKPDGRCDVRRHLLDMGTDPPELNATIVQQTMDDELDVVAGNGQPRPTELFSLPGFTSAVLTPTTFPLYRRRDHRNCRG